MLYSKFGLVAQNLILLIWAALLLGACSPSEVSQGQTDADIERPLIEATLMDYIEGTSNGQPDRLRRAFHPDFNLYSVNSDGSLRTWTGEDYISNITPGKKNSRVGKVLSIDYDKDVAIAKAEILIPGNRVFTDYFLMVKFDNQWQIIHKSYTSHPVEAE